MVNNPRLEGSVWSKDISSFSERNFKPNETPGPKNLPSKLTDGRGTALDYFELFWDESLWNLLVNETNRNAVYNKEENPQKYVSRTFKPVTVSEMKAFFGCRIAMEMLVYKDRYEQYWKMANNPITSTPGFKEIISRDRFLAIWSLLHCVDEKDPALRKEDKIYKSRPVFVHLLQKFQEHYVPTSELSLDEGMIPTKNALSIKQYLKDKPIKWGVKTFLLCDSRNGYIHDA